MSDALINGLSGAGGGIISQILTYPLLAFNTRQQTERKAKNSTGQLFERDLSELSKQSQSLGTYKELRRVVQEEGWEGLFRGLMPSLVGTAISQGVYYYFYQLFKDEAEAIALRRKAKGSGDGTPGMFSALIVASLAGCLNVLLTNPIWVVVTRMQTYEQARRAVSKPKGNEDSIKQTLNPSQKSLSDTDNYGTIAAIHDLYSESGIIGFWKGVLPTLIMVSNPSIQFMLYEGMLKQLKKRTLNKKGSTNLTALEVFLLGAVAKLGATVATYPLLVVKSRLQAKQAMDQMHQYTGTLDAILKMIKVEGVGVFYKGMGTKIVQSVFAAAILFMVKEELVKAANVIVSKKKVPLQFVSVK